MHISAVSVALFCLVGGAFTPNEDPALGPTATGQSIAEQLKDFTAAEMAIVPAGLISQPLQKNDLSTVLNYPAEGLTVLSLTGAQLRQAFERSALLFPEPNVGFLQIAGVEVTFSKKARPNSRVTVVTVNGSKLEDSRAYAVAMPTSLQRGQLGYSNLWDKAKVAHSFANVKLADILKGKHVSQSPPRWLPQD